MAGELITINVLDYHRTSLFNKGLVAIVSKELQATYSFKKLVVAECDLLCFPIATHCLVRFFKFFDLDLFLRSC